LNLKVAVELADGEKVKLTGEVFDRTHHDRLIDMLVAPKLYSLTNYLRLPKSGK
jgi:hypothetical protein